MNSRRKAYKAHFCEALYRNPIARFLYFPFLREPRDKTYIFVLGCYNSGTTLLNEILGHHPEISMLDTEGIYLTPELKEPEGFRWNRMYYNCFDQMCIGAENAERVFNRVKKDWGFWHDKSKPYFIEKSVANACWIEWLDKYFENSYFVWIVRNGYAVSEGIRRRTRGKVKQDLPNSQYPIEMCARQWVFTNNMIEEKLKPVKNKAFLKYEDLTADPEGEIRSLLRWLPIKEKGLHIIREFRFHGESSKIRDMSPESIGRLTPEEIRKINNVAAKDLEKFGYTVLRGEA